MINELTSTHLSHLRNATRLPSVVWRVAIHRPAILWAGTLASVPTTSPVSELVYGATIQGSVPNAWGLTVLVGTSVGDRSKGRLRARRYDAANNKIMVDESGTGLIDFQVGDTITIIDEHRPWPRHPRYADTVYMDYDFPYNAATAGRPQPVMGAPVVARVGETIKLVGEHSRCWAAGASLVETVWYLPNGSGFTTLGTEASPNLWIPDTAYLNGRTIELFIEDSNGESNNGHRLAFIYDEANPPPDNYVVESIRWNGTGYTASILMVDDGNGLSEAAIPPDAEILIWEDEIHWPDGGTDHLPRNSPFRDNIVFRGWIDGESIQPASANNGLPALRFEAYTIDRILNSLGRYNLTLVREASPADWLGAVDPTPDRAMHHLCTWRSTITAITDWFGAGGYAETEIVERINLPPGSLWQQLTALYTSEGFGALCTVASDMQSSIYASFDPNLVENADRANYPVVANLTDQDRRPAEIKRTAVDQASQITRWGVGGSTPYGSRSPDNPVAPQGSPDEQTRMIVPSQDTLNAWVGNMRAVRNNKLVGLSLPLRGYYAIDPIPPCFITLTTDGEDYPRLGAWTSKRFIPRGLNLTNQGGTILADLVVDAEVFGTPGVAIPIPTDPPPVTPPSIPPPVTPPPTPPPPASGDWTDCWVLTSSHLYYVEGIQGPPSIVQPTVHLADGSVPVALPPRDFAVDPFEPARFQFAIFSDSLNIFYRRDSDGGNVWERDWHVLCHVNQIFVPMLDEDPDFENLTALTLKAIRLDPNQQGWMAVLIGAQYPRIDSVETVTVLAQLVFNEDADGNLGVADFETQTTAATIQINANASRGLYLAIGAFNPEKVGYGSDVGSWTNRLHPFSIKDGGSRERYAEQWANGYGGPFFEGVPQTITIPAGWTGDQHQAGVMFDINDARSYAVWHNGTTTSAHYQGWIYNPETTLFTALPAAPSNAIQADAFPDGLTHNAGFGIATSNLGIGMAYSPVPGERAQKIRFFAGVNNRVWKTDTGAEGSWEEIIPTGDVGQNTQVPGTTNYGMWGLTFLHADPDKLYGGRIRYAETGDVVLAISQGGQTWYDRSGAEVRIQGNVRQIIPAWWL